MRLLRWVLALVCVVVAGASFAPGGASAHTGLESSDPADGEVVDGPLESIVLVFTGTPTALDDGIAVVDADGVEYLPVEVTQDGVTITARFDPPLLESSYAVGWAVRSDDTHTINGSFTFAVVEPAPTTTEPTAPATTVAATTSPDSSEPATTGPSTTESAPVTTEAAAPSTVEEPAETADAEAVALPPPAPPVPPALDADVDEGETVASFGRIVLFPAAVVAVGVLAFVLFALAGRAAEAGSLLRLVRWLGVFVVLGAATEVAGLGRAFGSIGDVLDSGAGRAAAVRVLAGIALVVGFGSVAAARTRPLSAAVVDVVDTDAPATPFRWRPAGRDVVGVVGAVVLVVSFAFDGHTVTEGPRVVHGIATIAHVAAASAWAGGLVALAAILWWRRSSGESSGTLETIVRFSVVATWSLAIVGVAGVAMAWFIESDLASYVDTEWGRLMLVKVGIVALVAALGAYNHFRLVPVLRAHPDDGAVVAHVRRSVTIEAVLIVVVAVVTALVVGASTL